MTRQLLSILAASLVAGSAAAQTAQTYPNKPVHLIVSSVVGSSPDLTARAIGQEISKRVGQPFIVENRVGVQGYLAAKFVTDAAPDGYTIYSGGYFNLHPIFAKTNTTV